MLEEASEAPMVSKVHAAGLNYPFELSLLGQPLRKASSMPSCNVVGWQDIGVSKVPGSRRSLLLPGTQARQPFHPICCVPGCPYQAHLPLPHPFPTAIVAQDIKLLDNNVPPIYL